jgi:hypothetical protein
MSDDPMARASAAYAAERYEEAFAVWTAAIPLLEGADNKVNLASLHVNRGAALLDKFAGFAEALSGIGDKLGQAQGAYDDALTRFAGNGGLLRQTEMLRDLGVKASKPVPDKLRKRVEALGPGIASGASTLAELPLLADETGAARRVVRHGAPTRGSGPLPHRRPPREDRQPADGQDVRPIGAGPRP